MYIMYIMCILCGLLYNELLNIESKNIVTTCTDLYQSKETITFCIQKNID